MIFSDMPTSPTPIRLGNTFSAKIPCAKYRVQNTVLLDDAYTMRRFRNQHACSDYSKQFQQTHVKSDPGYS